MRVRNWRKYQHYKDRRPNWIKVHRSLLDDPTFFSLSDGDARLLFLLWLLASEEDDGTLPPTDEIAWRLRMPQARVDKAVSGTLAHWIEDAPTAPEPVEGMTAEETTETLGAFDEFWTAYPRKVGKAAARRAYLVARKGGEWPGAAAVLEAVEVAKTSKDWKKSNGQYIPHPATWLNQGRWADEVVAGGAGYREVMEELGGCDQ